MIRAGLLTILAWSACCAAARALPATAVFVQGIGDASGLNPSYFTADAMIQSGRPLANFGALDMIGVGRSSTGGLYRSILRFDLSSLSGRVRSIRQARLVLTVGRTDVAGFPAAFPSPLTIALHPLLPPNGGWIEGAGASNDPEPGAVCWDWQSSDARAWAGEAGCGNPGTDYDPTAAAGPARGEGFWTPGEQWVFEFDEPAALQLWIDDPGSNTGWIVQAPDLETADSSLLVGLVRFWSDDASEPAARPRLEIEYDPADATAQAFLADGLAIPGGGPLHAMATTLDSGLDGSYGAAPTLKVGVEPLGDATRRWRSIFSFDLSPFRGHVGRLQAAELRLTVADLENDLADAGASPQTLALYRLKSEDAAWREGASPAGAAEPSAATWGWLARDEQRWAGGHPEGAGAGVPDVDYDPIPLATLTLTPSSLAPGRTLHWRILDLDALADWLDRPERNAGLKLECPTLESLGQVRPDAHARLAFHSDDAATPTLRPCLILTYQAAPSGAHSVWLDVK
jgi:hypothetical protein